MVKESSQKNENIYIDDSSLDFKRYISLFISNWYWFAIVLFITISIAYGINRYSEEVYTVTSTLLIKDEQIDGGSSMTNIFPGTNAFYNRQNLNNEIGILKSFKLNYRVMTELKDFHVIYIAVGKRGIVESRMYYAPFRVVYDSLHNQISGINIGVKILSREKYLIEINGSHNIRKEMAFGERFNEMGFDFRLQLRDSTDFVYNPEVSNKYVFYFVSPAVLANQYRNKLSVKPVEDEASLVILSISGTVPEQESDYLNKLMELYIQQGLDEKNEIARKTIEFINGQLRLISASLSDAEGEMENFRLDNEMVDISKEGEMIQVRLQKLEDDKNNYMLQKRYYEYLQEYLIQKSNSEAIISPTLMGVTDQILIGLVQTLADLEKQKKSLAMNLDLSANPLKVIDSNIATIKRSLAENVASGLLNIDGNLAEIDSRMKLVEKQIQKLPSKERQLINIQRKYDINNTVYTFLLEKKAEVEIAKASNVSDNRIIDYAGPYNRVRIRPMEKRNYSMALLWGILIPIFGIFIVDYLNNKIIDKKDIEKGTQAPIMGYISHNNLKSELPVLEKPGSAIAESFRSVRTNLKYFIHDINCPVISVSSTISAEGKTFISANLALIIASLEKKVLLIGLDLRKPRIHKLFNIENEKGMSSYLIGQDKFDDIIYETGIKNLWYTSSGPVPPNPAELIESFRMKEFIDQAKGKFDLIIIDTPPVSIVTDALLVSGLTDFYLFVVRQRYSSKNTLGLIEELYINDKIKNIGIIINDINLSGYYGYGLRYGYSLGYGYSYGYNYYGYQGYSKYGYLKSSEDYYKEY